MQGEHDVVRSESVLDLWQWQGFHSGYGECRQESCKYVRTDSVVEGQFEEEMTDESQRDQRCEWAGERMDYGVQVDGDEREGRVEEGNEEEMVWVGNQRGVQGAKMGLSIEQSGKALAEHQEKWKHVLL